MRPLFRIPKGHLITVHKGRTYWADQYGDPVEIGPTSEVIIRLSLHGGFAQYRARIPANLTDSAYIHGPCSVTWEIEPNGKGDQIILNVELM